MKRMSKLLAAAAVAVGALSMIAIAYGASSPTVSTQPPTSISSSGATLHGSVNPNGSSTTYQFQYGLTNAYGLTTSGKSAGHGNKSVAAKATVSHLLPGTTYHFRVAASNHSGQSFGSDHSFKTAGNPPPDAATGPASSITATSATLSAVINPHGANTTWAFQFGLSNAYSYTTTGGTVLATGAPQTVQETLTGLEPGAGFHYRIVAYHGGSVSATGADSVFYTHPFPKPVPRLSARTSPGRSRTAPYSFTTSGKVHTVPQFPTALQCTGGVGIRFMRGKHQVSSTLVPVGADCSFSASTTFPRRPRGSSGSVRLRVLITFGGNSYLAKSNARPETVRLG